MGAGGAFLYVWTPGGSWARVRKDKLREHVFRTWVDCFLTWQEYETYPGTEGEPFFGPFAVDLDGPEIAAVHREAAELATFLEELGVWPELQRWTYSGKKGFHLRVDPYALGVEAAADLNRVYRGMADFLAHYLGLQSVDRSCYSRKRLLRVPGTRHGGSGRACLPLRKGPGEWSAEAIVAAAEEPTEPEVGFALFWPREPVPAAHAWYRAFREAATAEPDHERQTITREATSETDLPRCVTSLLEHGCRPGQRNTTTWALSLALKGLGASESHAQDVLGQWTQRVHQAATGHAAPRGVLQNASSSIKSGYVRGEHSCAYIRSLGAECDAPLCTFVGAVARQEPDAAQAPTAPLPPPVEPTQNGAVEISLEDAVLSANFGRHVRFRGIPTRKDSAPLILPRKLQLSCNPKKDHDACSRCRHQLTGKALVDVTEPEDVLELALAQAENQRQAVLRKVCRIPQKCPGHKIAVLERQNLLEIAAQPFYEGTQRSESYRENQLYLYASDIECERPYLFEGTVAAHPKTGHAVQLCRPKQKLQRSFERFTLTDENKALLEAFRCGPTLDDIHQKLWEVHEDHEHYTHGIYGRRLHSVGVSLVWLSPLGFAFQGKLFQRGWLELLLVGDTGQGKTELVDRFLDLFGCGLRVSGENVSLAGLTAGVDRMNGRYISKLGVFARAHQQLVVIDECHNIHEEILRSISEARSGPILRMDKIVSIQAPAACRKIFSCNPIDPTSKDRASCRMSALPYPVLFVPAIFRSTEDVRRFDFVLGFKAQPKVTRLMNRYQEARPERRYPAQAHRALVQRAWSRRPEHYVFEPEAERAILTIAEGLSGCYSQAIPLFDPGDTKGKLARLSAALANAVLSTDESMERTIVRKEHVQWVAEYLRQIYAMEDLDFVGYSRAVRDKAEVTPREAQEASVRLRQHAHWYAVVDAFAWSPAALHGLDLCSMMNMTDVDARQVLSEMVRMGMIEKYQQGFRLTPRGHHLAKEILGMPPEPGESVESEAGEA